MRSARAVGAALGLEAPRVNALARQVPLLSSPGAIEQMMMHGPELGVSDSPQSEPFKNILSAAARLEGLPHRQGAHPSAYTFSFFTRVCSTGCPRSGWAPSDLAAGGTLAAHAVSRWWPKSVRLPRRWRTRAETLGWLREMNLHLPSRRMLSWWTPLPGPRGAAAGDGSGLRANAWRAPGPARSRRHRDRR